MFRMFNSSIFILISSLSILFSTVQAQNGSITVNVKGTYQDKDTKAGIPFDQIFLYENVLDYNESNYVYDDNNIASRIGFDIGRFIGIADYEATTDYVGFIISVDQSKNPNTIAEFSWDIRMILKLNTGLKIDLENAGSNLKNVSIKEYSFDRATGKLRLKWTGTQPANDPSNITGNPVLYTGDIDVIVVELE